MDAIATLVAGFGGFAQKQQLVAAGATDRMLTAAVRSGSVRRARQGWYSTRAEDDPEFRAVRVGGRLTGISALAALGAWTWTTGVLHVSVARSASRQRDQWNRGIRRRPAAHVDVRVHWDNDEIGGRGTTSVVHLFDALVRVVIDESFEAAVMAFDWATRTGRLDRIDFETVIRMLPPSRRPIANWVDPRCDSPPESITRTRLALRGYRLVSQVPVGEFERIDLVVEGTAAIEVDGRQHADTFESDRRKDLRITLAGLHAIRPTYRIVRDHFETLVETIEAAIRARDPSWVPPKYAYRHRVPRRRRSYHWRTLDAECVSIAAQPSVGRWRDG